MVNPTAHQSIVTQAEFDAVQGTSTLHKQHDGSVASKALLGGLARCGGCGYTLKIAGNKDRNGESFPVYYCKGRTAAKGKCLERASIRASYLDAYVEEQVLAALGAEDGLLVQAAHAVDQIEVAQRNAEAAEHELMLYVETDLISTIGRVAFQQGVTARQERLDEAREKVATLRAQAVVADDVLTGDLLQDWPELSVPERRQLMHGLLDKVVLVRSDGRNKATQLPLEERTTIVLRGGQVLQPTAISDSQTIR